MKSSLPWKKGVSLLLPIASLDNVNFEELTDNARKLITKYYPQWTDFNYHDPGITLVEMLAWLQEMQQFHLDQIGPRNKLKFLKILGALPREKQAASAYVRVDGLRQELNLPPGVVLEAGAVPFETTERAYLTPGRITSGFAQTIAGERTPLDGRLLDGGRLRFYPFGLEPAAGDAFYLALSTGFKPGEKLNLYFNLFEDYAVRRNAPAEDFTPLVELEWEYMTSGGVWQPAELVRDDTWQFLQRGRVSLIFPEAPVTASLPEPGYWLRVTLKSGIYDVPPLLNGVSLNVIPVLQQKTLSAYRDFRWPEGMNRADGRAFIWDSALARSGRAEVYLAVLGYRGQVFWQRTENWRSEPEGVFVLLDLPDRAGFLESEAVVRVVCYEENFLLARQLGTGDGFPGQDFEVPIADMSADSLAFMVEEEEGCSAWRRTPDFDSAGPDDRVFMLDGNTGRIIFGDCEQGRAPQGNITIIAGAVSLGADGNVQAGRINRLLWPVEVEVMNDLVASGGTPAEGLDEAFLRLRRETQRLERAVTYSDYETLVRTTPGLIINNCAAIPVSSMLRPDGSMDENSVTVVAQPFSLKGVQKLSPAYMDNIRRRLMERRLIGTKVSVLSPEYIGVEIFAEVVTKPHYRDAKERVAEAVQDYFSGAEWEFGRPVQYSALYGVIDTLDCVTGIRSLVVDAVGKGMTRSVSGDILLPPNGMAFLKQAEYVIFAGE
jgi:hypothetical protein